MFYTLLQNGKKITISDKNGKYLPSTFFIKDNKILVCNDEIGVSDIHDATSVENHINNMLAEGFTITIE